MWILLRSPSHLRVTRPLTSAPVKFCLLLVASGVMTGCFPVHMVSQPSVRFSVTNSQGRPVEGASILFTTEKFQMTPTKSTVTLLTDDRGSAGVEREAHWVLYWGIPDLGYSYLWRYCITAAGFGPSAGIVESNSSAKKPVAVVLVPAVSPGVCRWQGHPPEYLVN